MQFYKMTGIILLLLAMLAGCAGSSDGSNGFTEDDITQAISVTPISGMAPLTVSVDANATNLDTTGVISSYRWSFGEGADLQAVSGTHTYNNPGAYTLTLTVTNSEGTEFTITDTVHVVAAFNNTAGTTPAGAGSFFDSFEYVVDRDNSSDPTGQDNPFVIDGHWNRAKAINITGSHNGYLYTVNQIPGYQGNFPGIGSGSVLAMEARPGSLGSQTDFYLEYGSETGPNTAVPADVWFQFWIYPARYNDPNDQHDQISAFDGRFKFIYPCRGAYPCQEGDISWLNTLGYTTGEPFWANQDNRELFMTTIDPYDTDINYTGAEVYNRFKPGQTDVSENITRNRWTLVKIHYDTSGTGGTFEAWMHPLGDTAFTQVANWVDGADILGDGNLFHWTVSNPGLGHSVFRMPTTMDGEDSWIYLDDFTMATSEANLPTYPY